MNAKKCVSNLNKKINIYDFKLKEVSDELLQFLKIIDFSFKKHT